MYVCVCHGVTERHIAEAVDRGASRLRDLRHQLRVATDCGRCAACARDCLKHSLSSRQVDKSPLLGIQLHRTLPA